jgi:hypothetical protein
MPAHTPQGSSDRLVELDSRRRASLARIGRPEHTRYLAHAEGDGTIIMRPVDLVPAVVGERPTTLAPAEFRPQGVEGFEGLRDGMRQAAGVHEPAAEERQPRPPQADGDW